MKNLPHDYTNLVPTIMDVEQIYTYLDELIIFAKTGNYDAFEVCEAFCELIQVRQSDNYCSPKAEYALEVFNILTSYWPEKEEHLDSYLTVLLNLGLDLNVRKYLDDKLKGNMKPYETALIQEIFNELQA